MINRFYPVYYLLRGFIFGLLNPGVAEEISIQIEICDDCKDEEMCDEHEKEINETVHKD